MNPWLSEQLGAAHRDELRRAAARNRGVAERCAHTPPGHRKASEARRAPGWAPTGPALVGRARTATGLLLVRAGSRLAGGLG